MFVLAMILVELFKTILFWCVYQDVTKYTSLPYFSLAQFLGIIFMMNIGVSLFRSEIAYIYYYERTKKVDKLKHKISSMLACMILAIFYYICKIFM